VPLLRVMDVAMGVGFEKDIRPLFREEDREEMLGYFDLWSVDDVRLRHKPILERLEDGSMPCDTPWSTEHVDRFRRWVEAGCPK